MSSRASSKPRAADAGAVFDERAGRYDRAYDARSADGYALRSRMEVALCLVGSGSGAVLDAGMGPGRLCSELARRGWRVSGIDAAPGMVDAARQRLPEASERLLVAKIEALPFQDESFDAAVATGVLEYADVPAALCELARVLRPGALAVVSYPNPRALYGIWKTRIFYPILRGAKAVMRHPRLHQPYGARRIPPDRFVTLLKTAGLEHEETVYASFLVLPSPVDQLLPGPAERLGRRLEESGRRKARRLATQVVYAARKSPVDGRVG